MWWKLGLLLFVTVVLILCVIPIRTRATLIDPADPPARTRWTLSFIVSNMYLTPGTFALIGLLLSLAIFVGFRIVIGG